MLATDARTLLHRLTAAFPASGVGDDTVVLWLGYVSRVPLEVGRPAIDWLVEHCDRFPTVAEWQEACRDSADRLRARALPRALCALCEDGWVTVDATGRTTVARCPNGCIPNALAKEHGFRPLQMSESELARSRARLAEFMATLKAASAMPKVAPRSRRPLGRYRVDPETGHAEPLPRSDLS